ncbi:MULTISPECIES: SOS cell division inhibitor [unclassified Marinobacter]|uniref:SOS cell division inhibitor n=1 Tax=unclassified Marinobacter TaxID=83889 RepID=UPI0026E33BB1|nr:MULTISPECIES: SOS cell division inhibitor [unclassified Marinobacter]MDO6440826.1 SOS cell division inhibitor [Marinobacter sp. 2_MG-2023]MDO6823654.1 SOS cell division inhibitor [Marinobacter sp. 1_MG-2023]
MADAQDTFHSDPQACLASFDQLMAKLGRALAKEDWDALVSLNSGIKTTIEPMMVALEAGQVEPEPVRTRIEELRQFLDAAGEGAARSKAEAELALKGMNRNRSAAKAYQNISTSRPK